MQCIHAPTQREVLRSLLTQPSFRRGAAQELAHLRQVALGPATAPDEPAS